MSFIKTLYAYLSIKVIHVELLKKYFLKALTFRFHLGTSLIFDQISLLLEPTSTQFLHHHQYQINLSALKIIQNLSIHHLLM